MYDPFSNDDPDAIASLWGAKEDRKGCSSGCGVWIEDSAGGSANVMSRETEVKC